MNIEKINDFIDAYSRALQIEPEYTGILKELMPKLIEKYSKIHATIPVKQDNGDKYIIKPIDGKYSIEDFFLNRLMRNVLSLNIGHIDGKEKGGFKAAEQSIDLDIDLINRQLDNVLPKDIPDFQKMSLTAKKKVIMHEFEHALQTQYKTEAYVHVFREKNYKKIFDEISRTKNGKYKNIIFSEKEFEDKLARGTNFLDDVKHNGLLDQSVDHAFYENINEIFNETEALDMANARAQDRKIYSDGTYFERKNNESSNRNITNYGNLIKILLGEKNTFEGMYFTPIKMFEKFNNRYRDIFEEEFGKDKNAWENLTHQINNIKQSNSQELHLKLQKVLAKCFEKKINHDLEEGINTEILKIELMMFKKNSLWNEEKNIRNQMEHVQILKSIKEKIKEKDSKNLELQPGTGLSQEQIERKQKDEEATERIEKQIEAFKEATSDEINKKISIQSSKKDILDSQITKTETKDETKEMLERQEKSRLHLKDKLKTITAEEKIRLNELNQRYQTTVKINNQQQNAHRYSNGMDR